jgi:nitronate monooxygenase
MTRARFDAAVRALAPVYEAGGAEPPPYPERFAYTFEEQFEALLTAGPPVFSFVFGVPSPDVLEACRSRSIVTIGTATTPDEVRALDIAGVDLIVASGFEAGGHRGAFLAPVEESLVGTMPLVRIASEEVRTPIIAAGGIVDARGILAAHALGAEGVQIGTAFLATDESGATPEHRALLHSEVSRRTLLTRAFSGRLARGLRNRLSDELFGADAIAPYPYQGYLLRPVFQQARNSRRTDVVSLWSGQGAPLLRHTKAVELFTSLVEGMRELGSAADR